MTSLSSFLFSDWFLDRRQYSSTPVSISENSLLLVILNILLLPFFFLPQFSLSHRDEVVDHWVTTTVRGLIVYVLHSFQTSLLYVS